MNGQKIIILMLCINVMLYLFGFQLVPGDIMNKLIDTSKLDTTKQSTNISLKPELAQTFPEDVYQTSSGGLLEAFTDGLAMIWATAKFIFNLLTSPVAIFVRFLHPIIAIMIGIPFAIAYILAMIKFIRGADF